MSRPALLNSVARSLLVAQSQGYISANMFRLCCETWRWRPGPTSRARRAGPQVQRHEGTCWFIFVIVLCFLSRAWSLVSDKPKWVIKHKLPSNYVFLTSSPLPPILRRLYINNHEKLDDALSIQMSIIVRVYFYCFWFEMLDILFILMGSPWETRDGYKAKP